jgi:hypothetical protein
MASHVYPLAKQSFVSAGIDLTSANIKVALLTSAYTYSATHQYYSDLSGVIASSGNLASKTVTNGVFDAADITLTAVTSGSTIAALALYKDTGTGSTSNLICFDDGLSQATNGGDITVQWDNGSNKIFAL